MAICFGQAFQDCFAAVTSARSGNGRKRTLADKRQSTQLWKIVFSKAEARVRLTSRKSVYASENVACPSTPDPVLSLPVCAAGLFPTPSQPSERPRSMGLLSGVSRRKMLRASRRLFAAEVPKTVEPPTQTYPMVYGRVEETVMSPYKGGPVYLWLRSTIVWLRRVPGRHWIRWMERNWDYQKMCMMGMPELHIDPTKNRWRYYIDTSYYGGMLDKSHEDFYRYIMLYPTLAFFFHCVWCRVKEPPARCVDSAQAVTAHPNSFCLPENQ